MKDEINDPIEKSFGVKFFSRSVVLFICRLRGEGVFEGERAGGSKSFGRFQYVC